MEIDSILKGMLPTIDIIDSNGNVATVKNKISDVTCSRFQGATWFGTMTDLNVVIAGCGGIGSWTALAISRCHPNRIVLFDDDRVELANLSGQAFTRSTVEHNYYKTFAIHRIINEFSPSANVTCVNSHYDTYNYTYPKCANITVSAVDSMKSRKEIFESWLEATENVGDGNQLFIDGRLAAEEFQVYSFTRDDTNAVEKYKATLFDDSQAEAHICSYKQTSFCAMMIGNIIANIAVNYANNLTENAPLRDIPFFTYYNASFLELRVQ